MNTLANTSEIERQVAETTNTDVLRDLRARVKAITDYVASSLGPLDEQTRKLAILRLRIDRRLGELLGETVRHEGGRPEKLSDDTTVSTLPKGISRDQSSRFQRLAAVPAEQFEAYLAKTSNPSLNGALLFANGASGASFDLLDAGEALLRVIQREFDRWPESKRGAFLGQLEMFISQWEKKI